MDGILNVAGAQEAFADQEKSNSVLLKALSVTCLLGKQAQSTGDILV